jgi:SAM-dependent methyltransferase
VFERPAPGLVFGEVAEEFDRVRLSYPAALVADVLDYSHVVRTARRALEVGAGTGKATLAFAARGVPIVALEPDNAMADVLARHTANEPDVRIVRTTFERYQPAEGFGLLFCADAWHWTQPDTRWLLAAQALARGGALALFENNGRIDDPHLQRAMLDVLAEITPGIVVHDDPISPTGVWSHWPGSELADRDEFEDLAARTYPSHLIMSGRDYLTYMSTRSQCRMLAQPIRQRLLDALESVFSGEVPIAVETVLYLARLKL